MVSVVSSTFEGKLTFAANFALQFSVIGAASIL